MALFNFFSKKSNTTATVKNIEAVSVDTQHRWYVEAIADSKAIKYAPLQNVHLPILQKGKKLPHATSIDLKEIRNYSYGDDIRLIDSNATARYNTPYVKVYEEIILPQVCIVVDVSASSFLHNGVQTKKKFMAAMATSITQAIQMQKVECIVVFFDTHVQHIIRSRGNIGIAKQVWNYLMQYQPVKKNNQIIAVFQYLTKQLHSFHDVFFITDGWDSDFDKAFDDGKLIATPELEAIQKSLNYITNKHAFSFIKVCHEYDRKFPKMGIVAASDVETGNNLFIDTNNAYWQQLYTQRFIQHEKWWQQQVQRNYSNFIGVDCSKPYVSLLNAYLQNRNR
jgi:hypothetical protein